MRRLEDQLRRTQENAAAGPPPSGAAPQRSATPEAPLPGPTAISPVGPRRGDAFDPNLNPNAPGAPPPHRRDAAERAAPGRRDRRRRARRRSALARRAARSDSRTARRGARRRRRKPPPCPAPRPRSRPSPPRRRRRRTNSTSPSRNCVKANMKPLKSVSPAFSPTIRRAGSRLRRSSTSARASSAQALPRGCRKISGDHRQASERAAKAGGHAEARPVAARDRRQ